MSGRSRTNRRARRHLFLEWLESRQLLTVDFSGGFIAFPTSTPSGTSQNAVFSIANGGTTRYNGPVSIAFYIAPDGVAFDPNTAQLLLSTTRTVSLAAAGPAQNFSAAIPLNAALVAGDYRIHGVLDSNAKVVETDEGNNTMQSPLLTIVQPDYDLVPTFAAAATLPPSIVSGASRNASLTVVVTNPALSTATLPSVKVGVQIVARPAGALDDSQDVLLNRGVVNLAVGGTAPGKTRQASVSIQFPGTLADGEYTILVKVDTGNTLAEINETNNEAAFAHTVTVAPPFSDPALAFHDSVVIPPAVVADGRNLPLKFNITNLGNITIPAGTTGSLNIIAHNIGDASDTLLKTFTVQLGQLGPGVTRVVSVTPTILASLTDGTYEIDATLVTGLSSDIIANNSDATLATMTVGPPFFNVASTAPDSLLPPAVLGEVPIPGYVTVGITNFSNTFLPVGQRATISINLRPVNAVDASQDIPFGGGNVSVSHLGMGKTLMFRLPATVPAYLPGTFIPLDLGEYLIISKVNPIGLPETTVVDNDMPGDSLTIADPFIDLEVKSASANFPTPARPGMSAVGTVTLRNVGNVRVQGVVRIQFYATPTFDVTDGFLLGSGTFTIGATPGQITAPLNSALSLTAPQAGFTENRYNIIARIDPSSVPNDTNDDNDQRLAGSLVVSTSVVDMTIFSATNPFSGAVDGGTTGNAVVRLRNVGSMTTVGHVFIKYYASTSGEIDGDAIEIGVVDVFVSLPPAGVTSQIVVPLTLPDPTLPKLYRILAQITSLSTVDQNPNNNTTDVLGLVAVLPVI